MPGNRLCAVHMRDDVGDHRFDAEPNTLLLEDRSLANGFIQLPKVVLHAANLSRDAKLLYAILLSYAWQASRCFPGYRRLCEDMQASENMVRKYMRELQALRLLSQKRRGLGRTNIYTLHDLRTAKIEVLEPSDLAVLKPQKPADKEETEEKEQDVHLRNSKGNTSEGNGEPTSPDDGGVDELSRSLTAPGNRALSRLHQAARRNNNGFRTVSEVIHDAHSNLIRLRHPKATGTHPHLKPSPQIASCITDISAELGDSVHLRSNLSHVMRLFQESALPESVFVARLFEARAIVKDQRTTHARIGTGAYIHKPMPYFFSVVKDLLGLKDAQAEAELASDNTDRPTGQGREERWTSGQSNG